MSSGSFIVESSSITTAIDAASNITIHHHPIDQLKGPEPQAAVSDMLEIYNNNAVATGVSGIFTL